MTNIDKYVIVRTQNAGVFAGTVTSQTDTVVEIANARRLWYWAGAASLSEMAVRGVRLPNDCKFPAAVEQIEIIPATADAKASLEGVTEWKG